MAELEVNAITILEKLWKRWHYIVQFMLFGGFLGWVIVQAQPPVYEAKSYTIAAIDFQRTGKLTQGQSDRVFSLASTFLLSQSMKNNVVSSVQAAGLDVDIKQVSFVLERQDAFWTLKIRYPEAESATALANAWAEKGFQEIEFRTQEAQTAHLLNIKFELLKKCGTPFRYYTPYSDLCSRINSLAELDILLKDLQDGITLHETQSQGMIPGFVFSLKQKANNPEKPAIRNPNTSILCGSIIGFLLSMIWIEVGHKKDHRG